MIDPISAAIVGNAIDGSMYLIVNSGTTTPVVFGPTFTEYWWSYPTKNKQMEKRSRQRKQTHAKRKLNEWRNKAKRYRQRAPDDDFHKLSYRRAQWRQFLAGGKLPTYLRYDGKY